MASRIRDIMESIINHMMGFVKQVVRFAISEERRVILAKIVLMDLD